MREMTTKEITELGREMTVAKMKVLDKYGFSMREISEVVGVPESVVRRELKYELHSENE